MSSSTLVPTSSVPGISRQSSNISQSSGQGRQDKTRNSSKGRNPSRQKEDGRLKIHQHSVSDATWDDAAAKITTDIHVRRIVRGQVICIDAHRSPDGKVHFVAFWRDAAALPKNETRTIQLRYLERECDLSPAAGGWASCYEFAVRGCTGFLPEQIVSITMSRSVGEDRGICYVFYDANMADEPRQDTLELHWLEARARSWDQAADELRGMLRYRPVAAHQIIAMCAHESEEEGRGKDSAVYVAFYAEGLAEASPILGWLLQVSSKDEGWAPLHAGAARDGEMLGRNEAGTVVSFSGSWNSETGGAFFYTFYAETKGVIAQTEVVEPQAGAVKGVMRVMSLHTSGCGANQFARLVDALRFAQPDIVGLQDCTCLARVRLLALCLGLHYDYYAASHLAILSRYRIERTSIGPNLLGVRAELDDGGSLILLNVCLPEEPFPPYELHVRNLTPEEAKEKEAATQLLALRPALKELQKERAGGGKPCILLGSFASASTQDYAESFGGKLQWPCSQACVEADLMDTFLQHPHNSHHIGAWQKERAEAKGVTWIASSKEVPQCRFERVDYIHVSSEFEVVDSRHLDAGIAHLPEWPSSHKAVLSVLRYTSGRRVAMSQRAS